MVHLDHSQARFLRDELVEEGQRGNDIARVCYYMSKLARLALSFAGSESEMLCRAVLLGGGKAQNSLALIHTFLVAVYADLQRKAVFGYEKLDNT
jgi:hypothetical protein